MAGVAYNKTARLKVVFSVTCYETHESSTRPRVTRKTDKRMRNVVCNGTHASSTLPRCTMHKRIRNVACNETHALFMRPRCTIESGT